MDLEKPFERVPRKAALKRQKVSKRPVTLVMSLYAESKLRVKTVAGTSEAFDIRVEVHQGSALSSLLHKVGKRRWPVGAVLC